ncbi:HD domain-containing protein [Candidatus Woesearchaeota archaeon]|nr:HD domain-containing protein [Candidatus Woesearchaeota archaeon]
MEKIKKKISISDIREGNVVEDIFVVKIKKDFKPYSKGYSFTLVLTDSSGGSLDLKFWGDSDENKVKALFDSIPSDSVLKVSGKASSYQSIMQLAINDYNSIQLLKPGEYDSSDFIPTTKKDIEQMYKNLIEIINTISDEKIKILLLEVVEKDFKEEIKIHPAAIQYHHGWVGGLLEHILEVIEICETAFKINGSLNRNLLIAGAILHDIGKIEELEVTTRIKATRKGQLIGHLTMGAFYVNKKLESSQIDDLTKEKLIHLILSHHGKFEYGSPKEPMFPEAAVLYYADELSSKLAELHKIVEDNKDVTEDDFTFVRRKGNNIFLR